MAPINSRPAPPWASTIDDIVKQYLGIEGGKSYGEVPAPPQTASPAQLSTQNSQDPFSLGSFRNELESIAPMLMAGMALPERGAIKPGEAGFEMLSPRMAEMLKIAKSGPKVEQMAPELQSTIDSVATTQLANIQGEQAKREAAAALARKRMGRDLSREIVTAGKEGTLSTPRSALKPPPEESLLDKLRNLFKR